MKLRTLGAAAMVAWALGAGAVEGSVSAAATGLTAGLPFASSEVCRFDTGVLPELSGLALSRVHRNVLWAINDSGNRPYVYAIDARTCRLRARLTLLDTPARDHEALAVGKDAAGRNVIWVGDIGDNQASWPYVRIHKVYEPSVLEDAAVSVVTYRFTYPGGPRNAEALMADPNSERLWVISKSAAGGAVYRLPSPLSPSLTPMRAIKVGPARATITDAALSPDAKRYIARDYFSAEVFRGLPVGRAMDRFALPIQPQGEAITFAADGKSVYVASESSGELLKVKLPARALGSDAGVAGLFPQVAGFDTYPLFRALALGVGGLLGLTIVARLLAPRRRTGPNAG